MQLYIGIEWNNLATNRIATLLVRPPLYKLFW
jgi:hypothetical protein